jgi:hypothetical protein
VLPAWDGSKTALAGSKPGFGTRKSCDLALYWPHRVSETGTGRAPAGTTKSFPTALDSTEATFRTAALTQVREYTHGFFANTAHALQADFTPYLPHVVPLALNSLALDDGPILDGLVEDDDDSDDDGPGGGGGGVVAGVRAALGDHEEEQEEEEEEDEEDRRAKMKVHTAIMDEKMSACAALGSWMQATKGSFGPYIEQV